MLYIETSNNEFSGSYPLEAVVTDNGANIGAVPTFDVLYFTVIISSFNNAPNFLGII